MSNVISFPTPPPLPIGTDSSAERESKSRAVKAFCGRGPLRSRKALLEFMEFAFHPRGLSRYSRRSSAFSLPSVSRRPSRMNPTPSIQHLPCFSIVPTMSLTCSP
jgi:hypothetical protein